MLTTTLLTDNWTFHQDRYTRGIPVRLPHDAMIGATRSADAPAGNHGGFFPGSAPSYRRRWTAPSTEQSSRYRLVFDGVYGKARVSLNGVETGCNFSPYRPFTVDLGTRGPGEQVLIDVEVDNTELPNSRWYTGTGIYRPVWLQTTTGPGIAPDGISVRTSRLRAGAVGTDAVVEVTVAVDHDVPQGAELEIGIARTGRTVATVHATVRDTVTTSTLVVRSADLWSAEHPDLYEVTVRLVATGDQLDIRTVRTGLRTVEVDARRGLRINGSATLLRGTAVHHDNGILGAATFTAAERRRARILKDAGYNAVRSAHNPLSRAFLDACDEFGLYVMDELTDVWFRHKTPHDEAPQFRELWRDDAAAMIAEDRNRPSVIMYSLGNEIAEAATDAGVELATEIHSFFTDTDPTRPTTLAVNPLLAMMARRTTPHSDDAAAPPERKPATSTAANQMAAKMGKLMVLASTVPAAEEATRDVFGAVDIAGYNYGYASYRGARRRHPERVILGTESMPGDLPAIWKRVTSIPGVIGDFSWTGWDYLGEVGLGYWTYGAEPGGIAKPYPGVLAGCGVFDITGTATGTLLLVQAVWGVTDAPGIALRPMDKAGQRPNKTPWLPTDALPSWSWRGYTGRAEIEVYSAADEVELFLNDKSIGRRKAGPRRGYVARFTTSYQPGTITAIAYRNGVEAGRSSLRSAREPRLRLRPESDVLAGPDDLAYVWIELADDDGIVDLGAEDHVTVEVSGSASLAGLGSAAPATEESFTDDEHTTYRGRALAIVRGGEANGEVSVSVTSRRHGAASVTLTVSGEVQELTTTRTEH